MPLLHIFIFIFGAMIGSFLNVLIFRLPRGMNWVYKRSFCPNCKTSIPFWRNIPLFTYVIQRGKCHNCSTSIHFRYPVVELLMAAAAVILFPENLYISNLVNYLFLFSVFAAFLVHFVVDLQHKILPDEINIYLAILFLSYGMYYYSFLSVLVGGLVGFFIPYSVAYLFYKLKGVEGLGGGDIKLFGALGLYLGPQGIMFNIFISCFLGSVIGIFLILFKVLDKDKPLAFGPFIIIAAFFQIFFPDQVTQLINYIGF